MKTKPLLLLALLAIVISCQKDEPHPVAIKGTLKVNVGLFISVNEIENRLKSTWSVEDFRVTIYNHLALEVLSFGKAADMPDEIELEPGQYYVTAHSDNDLPVAFENPYYYGESALFTIEPDKQVSVTVNCELANTMVTILYSDRVRDSYTDYVTTVSTSEGSLVFDSDETRAGYFRPLPMNISAELTWQNAEGAYETKTLTGTIPDPQKRRKYEIHVDAASPGGETLIEITLDETIDEEIVNIDDFIVPGPIATGDLLITEIMYDPTSVNDPYGEWIEIYNTTGQSVDLNHVVIRTNSLQHVISATHSIEPHSYIVLARREDAVTNAAYCYSSLSLNNSNGSIALYNYGTDGTNGSLIFKIDYGAAGFPRGTGASICLSPLVLNYTDAVLSSSWCVSSTEYSTGDRGTPGAVNDNCP